MRGRLAAALALLAAALVTGVAVGTAASSGADARQAPSGAGTFAVRTESFYLTADEGYIDGAPALAERDLMRRGFTSGDALDLHVPLLRATPLPPPPLPAPLEDTAARHRTWYLDTTWAADQQATDAAIVRLDFAVDVHLDDALTVRALDVAPDGRERLVAEAQRPGDAGIDLVRTVHLRLPLAGTVFPEGHTLALRTVFDDDAVLNALRYGSAEAPSGIHGLKLRIVDSDDDGLGDSDERDRGTDPQDRDSDGDGVSDGDEVARGSDPNEPYYGPANYGGDQDDDGLSDEAEDALGTDPTHADSDRDGTPDGIEHRSGADPLDPDDTPADRDGDGLPDSYEESLMLDPGRADSDGNGVSDADEDLDQDGLSNIAELARGTDALHADTDRDGVSDGDEIRQGRDPLMAQQHGTGAGLAPVAGALLFVIAGAAAGYYLFRRFAA